MRSMNKFKILDNDTTIIYTENKYGNISGQFYIDTEDLPKVLMVKCRIYDGRVIYDQPAKNGKCRGQRQLSRYIMGIAEDYDVNDRKNSVVVDHIDHNPFNNKKCNLRIISFRENMNNRTDVDDCKNFKGIHCATLSNKNYYCATICFSSNSVDLGKYKKFQEALFARFFAEKMIFGEVKQMERPTKLSKDREKEIADKVIAKIVRTQTLQINSKC